MNPDDAAKDSLGTLADAPRGASARVVGIDLDPARRRRLLSLGLCPGVTVEVLGRALGGDPLAVRCGSVHLMIPAAEARAVRIRAVGSTVTNARRAA